MGIPAGVGASYGTSRVMSKVAKSKGYGFKKIVKGSPEAKAWGEKMRALRGKGKMSGQGKKLIDQKFSIRDVAHQVNQIPKTIKDLKGSGMRMPPRPEKSPAPYGDWAGQYKNKTKTIGGGLKRLVKGSAEAKAWGEKMRALRKK